MALVLFPRMPRAGASPVTTGSQCRAQHGPGSISWLAIVGDDALAGEIPSDSMVMRIMWTPKEQCLSSHLFEGVDELHREVAPCVEARDDEGPIERMGHRTLRKASGDATAAQAAR
ncbi:MAG: hypothetical protein WAL35_09595 [Acidimicrobiales bacterium]